MADLIDRAALFADIDETFVFSGRVGSEFAQIRGANKIIDRIKAAKAVDAVPVVRCKDCKYFSESGERPELFGFCQLYPLALSRLSNGFCDMGERRTDGNTDRC